MKAPVAVEKAYDFVLWLLPKVENFPKAHRFTIGERLTTNGLDLLTSLVEAAYSREKAGLLEQASRKVNSAGAPARKRGRSRAVAHAGRGLVSQNILEGSCRQLWIFTIGGRLWL